jgi:hypothetical protein
MLSAEEDAVQKFKPGQFLQLIHELKILKFCFFLSYISGNFILTSWVKIKLKRKNS